MASTTDSLCLGVVGLLLTVTSCACAPPCPPFDGAGTISVAADYFPEDGEVVLIYDDSTHVRALSVSSPGRLAARINVEPPPGMDVAIAQGVGRTFLTAADDDGERAYARVIDDLGVLLEGGISSTPVPLIEPPALIVLEDSGTETCLHPNENTLRPGSAGIQLDDPVALASGEHAFGTLGGSPAFAMVEVATAIVKGLGEDTGYVMQAVLFRTGEASP